MGSMSAWVLWIRENHRTTAVRSEEASDPLQQPRRSMMPAALQAFLLGAHFARRGSAGHSSFPCVLSRGTLYRRSLALIQSGEGMGRSK